MGSYFGNRGTAPKFFQVPPNFIQNPSQFRPQFQFHPFQNRPEFYVYSFIRNHSTWQDIPIDLRDFTVLSSHETFPQLKRAMDIHEHTFYNGHQVDLRNFYHRARNCSQCHCYPSLLLVKLYTYILIIDLTVLHIQNMKITTTTTKNTTQESHMKMTIVGMQTGFA